MRPTASEKARRVLRSIVDAQGENLKTTLEQDDIDPPAGGRQIRVRAVRHGDGLAWRCHQGGGEGVAAGVGRTEAVVRWELAVRLGNEVAAREVNRSPIGGRE